GSNTPATINLTGNFTLSGGTFTFATASNVTATLNVSGNFAHTAGTLIDNGNQGGAIVFKKTGTQSYTSGGTVTNAVNYTVNSGSTLNMGTSTITGAGSFTLSSGAGLMIGSLGGISTSGATGNIQSTGTRSYSTGANYTYTGASGQVPGNGLPSQVND